MSSVKLGDHLKVDLDVLLVTKLMVQANSGGGKSYLIRKFLEETHGKVQQIVLDIEGEFGSLREKYDYILAGKDADVAATPETAELLALKVLELEADIIIDLYELKQHERILFVRRFLDSMVNAPKKLWHPCMVILDEAHVFAPEKGESQALGAVTDIATRGRKRGFCLIPATQRIAKLHKDVAAECGNKLIGRTSLDIDMKRAGEELGFNSKADFLSLRDLEPGEFFAFGPAISKQVVKATVGQVKTHHPKAGQRIATRAPVPTGKIKAILEKLTDLPKQAAEERKTVEDYRIQIRTLTAEIKQLKNAGLSSRDAAELKELRISMRSLTQQKQRILKTLEALTIEVKGLPESGGLAPQQSQVVDSITYNGQKISGPVSVKITPGPAMKQFIERQKSIDSGSLGRCERAIIKFLAGRAGKSFNQSQIGAWTGYSKKSSSFQNALSRLSAGGWVVREHQRVQIASDRIDAARDILGSDYESAPETLEAWKSKLSKCPRAIFELLLKNPTHLWNRAEISEATGYSDSSSSFQNALSELSTLGLMRRDHGHLQLNPEVMDV